MNTDFTQNNHYAVIGIPLNRPEIVSFLKPPLPVPRGEKIQILGQRPTLAAETVWINKLYQQPTIENLLAIDHPENHLISTFTDRLVPIEFFKDPSFLTRNLGGWTPIYFGVAALPEDGFLDPLLQHLEVLADYGRSIHHFGADPALVEKRLADEVGATVAETAVFFQHLHQQRPPEPHKPRVIARHIDKLYAQIAEGETAVFHPISKTVLLDELMGWMVRQEQARRDALANGKTKIANQIIEFQAKMQSATGLMLILKGEYIVGRSRRSTVMIAPDLGVVVKQPGAEPFHEIELSATIYDGQPENWPTLTHDKSLVTARGRVRLTLEEDLIPRLYRAFQHPLELSTLLGLTMEPFVVGKTTQQLAQADHAYLTPEIYETYILHQQVAEAMQIENGDWHSANFVVRDADEVLVHIDWGAARPLRTDELTPESALSRLNQVKNIAYSFHNEALAAKVTTFHEDLLADADRMGRIRERAELLARR